MSTIMPQNLCFDIGIFSLKTKQVTTCELESKQPKVGCRLWLRSSSFSVFRQEIEKDRKTYITYVQKYLSWRGLAERTRYKSTTTFRCIYVNICLFFLFSVAWISLEKIRVWWKFYWQIFWENITIIDGKKPFFGVMTCMIICCK